MRRRFFVERFAAGRAELRGETAHHAGRVLRAEPGQLYELSDGREVWLARIERVRRDAVEFTLLEPVPVVLPALETVLALSIVKFDRFEWALEKATELNVAAIIPLAAARSEMGLVAAAPKRAARWEKILLEAAQQSRRLRPPVLFPLAPSSTNYLSRGHEACFTPQKRGSAQESGQDASMLRFCFSEAKDAASLHSALEHAPRTDHILLAFGPEGGWTEEERRAASEAHWAEVSLGPNILRTETAVVAALAAVNYAWGGFEGQG